MPPSLADLNALTANKKVDYGVIACHDGSVIKFAKPKFISKSKYINIYNTYSGYLTYTAQLKIIKELSRKYGLKWRYSENDR